MANRTLFLLLAVLIASAVFGAGVFVGDRFRPLRSAEEEVEVPGGAASPVERPEGGRGTDPDAPAPAEPGPSPAEKPEEEEETSPVRKPREESRSRT